MVSVIAQDKEAAAFAPAVVVITGGAGFIGGTLVRWLLATYPDLRVVTYDSLTYAGNLDSLADVFATHGPRGDGRHYFVKADVCDAAALSAVLDGKATETGGTRVVPTADAMAHLAAESHVDRSILGPAEFINTNVVGTQVVLECVRGTLDRSPRPFRMLHVGTDEVYGDLGPQDVASVEDSPIKPSSPYAASKASADHLIGAWHRTFGTPVLLTRCGNNYGPYQFPEKLIPLVITRALAGASIPVYGDGMQIRDWIHAEDHARALWTVLTRGTLGRTYNVSAGEQRTNREVITSILRQLGRPESLMTRVVDRLGHDRRYALDNMRITFELGWRAEHSWDDGISATVRWFEANREWWGRVTSEAYRAAEALYLTS
ncbi:MAG: dTDP-glucose 4,6-dehydratase [Verrucomicrobia bacterium]|nr:dTDP-glucose 4,6-dehydratase [Verrucomicrobiota bacterium]